MTTLETYGWNNEYSKEWNSSDESSAVPARIVADFGTSQRIAIPEIRYAEPKGKLAHTVGIDSPKIGDWVSVKPIGEGRYSIVRVLPRKSELAREVVGNITDRQVIAANVDIGFVVASLNADFSPERIERFLYQLSASNILPIIVLNKADLIKDPQQYIGQIADLNATIIVCSALNGQGTDEIIAHIPPGKTAVLLGSSGVGKSTITNALLGRDAQTTQNIRHSNSTGKHTTVHRELFVLPSGGKLIDSPGIRELQLWGEASALDDDYRDIVALIRSCKFTSCKHQQEPGCCVQLALYDGTLELSRWHNYQKMSAELKTLSDKQREKHAIHNRVSRRDRNQRDRDQKRDYQD